MSTNAIASELSYAVLLKRQAEQVKKDTQRVTAPTEKPAKFDGGWQ